MSRATAVTDISRLYDIAAKSESALRYLAEEVVRSCEPYVPYRTGWLMRCVRIEPETASSRRIVYYADYASECYHADHPFSKKRHPLATARWFEAAKSTDLSEWIRHAAIELLI